jgi:hypothetical protein
MSIQRAIFDQYSPSILTIHFDIAHRTKRMTDSKLSPANTDIIKLQKELDLQAAVAGRENPFKDFDWGNHLITWPQVGQFYEACAHKSGRGTRSDCIFASQRFAMETCIQHLSPTEQGMGNYHARGRETGH